MAVVTTNTDVTAIDLGCGHRVYLADDFIVQRRNDHKTFYCNVCGGRRHYPDESDTERLRRQLASKEDQLDTMRADRDHKEYQRRAAVGQVTKIKKRVGNGVCPCCNRTFKDLARHMANKHPSYAPSEDT